jgi:hypothetical protein
MVTINRVEPVRRGGTSKSKDKPTSVALLPYVQTTYGRLSRMLAGHNIKSVGLLARKMSSFLRPVKDDLRLRTPGVFSIPCECGQVYIGQAGRSIDTRIKDRSRHIRLGHPEKSAVAEHTLNRDHLIRIQDTQILSTTRLHGPTHQGGDRVGTPPKQYKQGRWPDSERVMETSLSPS